MGVAGCFVEKDPATLAKYRERLENQRKFKSELNKAWREGFGFSNPNPDRISKGLPPLDFDGREREYSTQPYESDRGWWVPLAQQTASQEVSTAP